LPDAEFRLFVISGGPGSGKTTVIRALENLQFWRRYIASAYDLIELPKADPQTRAQHILNALKL
jgi:predicted ATPase